MCGRAGLCCLLWLLAALLAGVPISVEATTPATPHDRNGTKVWTCGTRILGLETTTRVLVSYPGQPEYTNPPDCSDSGTVPFCSDATRPPVDGATLDAISNIMVVFYDCGAGQQFATGSPFRVSQCLDNNIWSPVWDTCIDECVAPRDCCALADYGYNSDYGTQYLVSPNGAAQDLVTVECDLGSGEDDPDGGWLLLLRHSKGSTDLNLTLDQYSEGVGDLNSTSQSYFLGVGKMAELTKDGTDDRPFVMKMEMEGSDGTLHHAIYYAVLVDPSTLVLTSLGDYHGNAGDRLQECINKTFCASGSSRRPCWWGLETSNRKSFLTSEEPKWGDVNLENVKVWLKPQDCDKALNCPPLVDPNLQTKEALVPLSRAPGDAVPFTCNGAPTMVIQGSLTSDGEVECQASTTDGQPHVWVPDECVLNCPPDYDETIDGKSCLKFGPKVNNHMEAVDGCAEDVASLAYINDHGDLTGVVNVTYFIANVVRNDGEIFPSVNATTFQELGYECVDSKYCGSADRTQCVRLGRSPRYEIRSCLQSSNYACMLPAMCPPDYQEHKGRCYKLVDSGGPVTFQDALKTCNHDGSALAYPKNMDTLNMLVRLVKAHSTPIPPGTPVNIALGLNTAFGNLTVDGRYNPDDEVKGAVAAIGLTNTSLTFLTIHSPSPGWNLSLATRDATTQYYFCEFHGPIGCWNWPQIENMTLNTVHDHMEWNNVGQLINYTCNPGYFVDGQVGNKSPQYLTCHGQLGGWHPSEKEPPLQPCIGVVVCNETIQQLPMEPEDMLIIYHPNYRFETHSFSYKCLQKGMTTPDGEKFQNFVCTETNGSYAFNKTVVESCNRCHSEPDAYGVNLESYTLVDLPYLIGQNLSATCKSGFLFSFGVKTRMFNCTESGWSADRCYKVCENEPNVHNATTDWRDDVWWTIQDFVTATCTGEHLYFAQEMSKTRRVNCKPAGWKDTPGCQQVCKEQLTVGNASVDLQERWWLVDEPVAVDCSHGYRFPTSSSDTTTVQCTSSGWDGQEGCVKACLGPPSAPKATPTTWDPVAVYTEGDTVLSTCHTNHVLSSKNDTTQSLVCRSDGWHAELECSEACPGAPQVVNATTNWNQSLAYAEGDYVNASCFSGHYFATLLSDRRMVKCMGGEWEEETGCEAAVAVPECGREPTLDDATIDWTNRTYYSWERLTVTCDYGKYFASTGLNPTYRSQKRMVCRVEGWSDVGVCVGVFGSNCTSPSSVISSSTVEESTWNNNRGYLIDESFNYTCKPSHLHLPDGVTVVRVKCGFDGWDVTSGCEKVCTEEPRAEGGVANWTQGAIYPVGASVNASCTPGLHTHPDGGTTQELPCTEDGWALSVPCEQVCMGAPDSGGLLNLTWPPNLVLRVNESHSAPCPDGHLATDDTPNATYACTGGGWFPVTTCEKACTNQPALIEAGGGWGDGGGRFVGDQSNVTCPLSHLTQAGSPYVTHNCTDDGWLNTSSCVRVCLGQPANLAPNMTWPGGVSEVGRVVDLSCPPSHLTSEAKNATTYTCTAESEGWQNPTPCIRVCLGEPNVTSASTDVANRDLWTVGDQTMVWCAASHHVRPGVRTYQVTCTSSGWQEDMDQCVFCEYWLPLAWPEAGFLWVLSSQAKTAIYRTPSHWPLYSNSRSLIG